MMNTLLASVSYAAMGAGGGTGDPHFANVVYVANFKAPTDASSNSLPVRVFGMANEAATGKFGQAYSTSTVGFSFQTPFLSVLDSGGALDLGSGDFTIEMWVAAAVEPSEGSFFNCENGATLGYDFFYDATNDKVVFRASTDGGVNYNASQAEFLLGTDGVSLATFFDGNFHHIVAERVGSTVTVYVDGNAGGTTWNISTDTIHNANTEKLIGNRDRSAIYWRGEIDEVRVSVGSNRYNGAFTPPSSAFTNDGSTDLLVSIDDDYPPTAHGSLSGTWTAGAWTDLDAPLCDATGLYSTAGGLQGLYYTPGTAGDWSLGTGDFVIECFGVTFEATASRDCLIGVGDNFGGTGRTWRIAFDASNQLIFRMYDSSNVEYTVTCTTTFATDGTAYDIAVERVGTTVTFYVDGVAAGSGTISANTRADSTLALGVNGAGETATRTDEEHEGYMTAARITVGTNRYNGAYTPPTLPLPVE